MAGDLVILLVGIPFFAGVLTILLTGRAMAQRGVGYFTLAATLGVAVWGLGTTYAGGSEQGRVLVTYLGGWPAPFGITMVLDVLAALMSCVSAIVLLLVFIYCCRQLPENLSSGFFHPLYHFLAVGVYWSFITGDLFNLFVAFEIMLMASYALMVLGTSVNQMRQAYKYVLLNLLASMLFVTCCGLIYALAGTLSFADLARLVHTGEMPAAATPVFALMLVVFGAKTAIFPLWFWLPDTYDTIHAAIGGLFAGLLTKVGAYVLIRIFVMIGGVPGGEIAEALSPLLLVSAGVTMFVGVLGAVSMHTVRRILSIHIISQIGYMVLGIALAVAAGVSEQGRELALAGAIFFIFHNMIVKSTLFLCGGLIEQHAGSDDLDKIGGLLQRAPWLATLFFIAALSLAGLPPLSGFFGKFALIRETFDAKYFVLGGLAILTSLFTLLSMLKIWSYAFWSPGRGLHVSTPQERPKTAGGLAAIAVAVVVALSMGLGAHFWFDMARSAARGVVDPSNYVNTVLAEAPGRTEAATLAARAPATQEDATP